MATACVPSGTVGRVQDGTQLLQDLGLAFKEKGELPRG